MERQLGFEDEPPSPLPPARPVQSPLNFPGNGDNVGQAGNENNVDVERMAPDQHDEPIDDRRDELIQRLEVQLNNRRHSITKGVTWVFAFATLAYLIYFEGVGRIQIFIPACHWKHTTNSSDQLFCGTPPEVNVENMTHMMLDMSFFVVCPFLGLIGLLHSVFALRFPMLKCSVNVCAVSLLQMSLITLFYQTILLLADSARYLFHVEHHAFNPYDYLQASLHFLFIFVMDMNYLNCIRLVHYNDIRVLEIHQTLLARQAQLDEEEVDAVPDEADP